MEYQKYQILLVDLGNGIGSEQVGVRPVLLIQEQLSENCNTRFIVAPFTSCLIKRELPTHVLISPQYGYGLTKDSMLILEQITSISIDAIIRPLGYLNDGFGDVDRAIRVH